MRNNTQSSSTGSSTSIRVLQKKKYNCLCKIFCCKCIYCCQSVDFSLLTSEHRKTVFHTMIKEYVKTIEQHPDTIIDPFFILLGLLMGDQDSLICQATNNQINDNGINQTIISKQDLEFYIPQLCTYLVFHEEMKSIPIFNLLERTALMDLQFAMKYYLYMKSLQLINENSHFKAVIRFNKQFKQKMDIKFKHQNQQEEYNPKEIEATKKYNSRNFHDLKEFTKFKCQDQPKPIGYQSIFKNQNQSIEKQFSHFQSTLTFLEDIVKIGQIIMSVQDRKEEMTGYLRTINQSLPAQVFLPLRKFSGKNIQVCSIVYEQCKVYQTKSRAPFYLCLQVYQSSTQQLKQYSDLKIRSTTSLEGQLKRSAFFQQDSVENICNLCQPEEAEIEGQKDGDDDGIRNSWLKQIYNLADRAKQIYDTIDHNHDEQPIVIPEQKDESQFLFGQSSKEQLQRMKLISPFSSLPSYNLVHLMVKTNDDLRQQSFAMQLLNEFNTIFAMEQLPINVLPYEVITLGHNCGIIEFLKDTLTLDELIKKEGNFQFIRNNSKKRKNFRNTLVAYCLVTYFLQVKDRHNGNILIRKDGSIIHIDYGFLISNSPGKGVQLQKSVPFKMTSQYIETLGGIYSKSFSKFRKLFFQGYQACIKHQHRILILTKLMYSSHGSTMPCFLKGNQAIEAMQERFNPIGMRTDGDLSLHCQELINKSIDNWRVKWYDKWQYYMQGILY